MSVSVYAYVPLFCPYLRISDSFFLLSQIHPQTVSELTSGWLQLLEIKLFLFPPVQPCKQIVLVLSIKVQQI